jgi:hypothetical protein
LIIGTLLEKNKDMVGYHFPLTENNPVPMQLYICALVIIHVLCYSSGVKEEGSCRIIAWIPKAVDAFNISVINGRSPNYLKDVRRETRFAIELFKGFH